MKQIVLVLAIALFFFGGRSQTVSEVTKKLGLHPIFFLDKQEIDFDSIKNYNPYEIAHVHIFTPKKARKKLGDKGADGAIYVTSVKKAKEVYWKYFSTKSMAYKNSFPSPDSDTNALYILNNKKLLLRPEGSLYQVANKNFRKLKIIGKKELLLKYDVTDKQIGIVIRAKKVRNVKPDHPKQ